MYIQISSLQNIDSSVSKRIGRSWCEYTSELTGICTSGGTCRLMRLCARKWRGQSQRLLYLLTLVVLASMSAPRSRRISTSWRWPSLAAQYRAVLPPYYQKHRKTTRLTTFMEYNYYTYHTTYIITTLLILHTAYKNVNMYRYLCMYVWLCVFSYIVPGLGIGSFLGQ